MNLSKIHLNIAHSPTYVLIWDGMDWTDVAEDREQWRALGNTIMNLRVP
jgi:hypothetical protein